MTTMTQPDPAVMTVEVTGGVGTHKDTHTAAALDSAGRVLGSAQFSAEGAGYAALLGWLRTFGRLVLIGMEGTGVYGHGLACYLREQGVSLVEVDRPDRKGAPLAGQERPGRRPRRCPRRACSGLHGHPPAARRAGRGAAGAAGGPALRGGAPR